MAEITRFLGMSVSFCEDYESGPHIHVHYHPHNGSISLEPFAIMENSQLPPRAAMLALEWAMLNANAIKKNWKTLQEGGKILDAIPPLA